MRSTGPCHDECSCNNCMSLFSLQSEVFRISSRNSVTLQRKLNSQMLVQVWNFPIHTTSFACLLARQHCSCKQNERRVFFLYFNILTTEERDRKSGKGANRRPGTSLSCMDVIQAMNIVHLPGCSKKIFVKH
jgi:hypothetical protein